jgi:hypothetical protein
MSALHWILIVLAGLIVLEVVLTVLGIGGVLTYIVAALYHMFKPEEPPGENDDFWDPSQGRNVD